MGYQNTDVFVELIMRSDSERPNLLGQMVSLEELIQERCYYLDARRLRAVMTEDQIDMIWSSLLRTYNLTREGLVNVVQGMGYTEEEARRQLGRMNTVNQLIDMRVNSNIIVEKADAEAYYNANPAYHDGVYTLQRAIMLFEADASKQEEDLKQQLEANADALNVTWSEPFTIGFSEIAPDKAQIHNANLNEIVLTGKTANGFELYKVVARKEPALKTFAERYDEITEVLRRPQAEKMLKEYQDSLHKKLVIEYL